MNKAELHRKYADALDLCAKHGLSETLAVKIDGSYHPGRPYLSGKPSDYSFLMAVIESKPVYLGDRLYWTSNRHAVIVTDGMNLTSKQLTFELPSRPKTFTLNGVELIAPDNEPNGYSIGALVSYKWKNAKDAIAFRYAIKNLLEGKQGDLLKQILHRLKNKSVVDNSIEPIGLQEEIELVLRKPEQDTYNQGYVDSKAFANRHGEISLRDHFAGLAMQGFINVYVNTGNETPGDEYLAGWSYKQADAMLAEKKRLEGKDDN